MSTLYDTFPKDKRPLTLNSLRQQQYSLNRLLILAIQSGDTELQASLERELKDKEALIDRMNAGIRHMEGPFL